MKVTYLHHSTFCVEIAERVLVFDYYDGKSVPSCTYNGVMPEFPKDTRMYVFSSHSHRDHFDKEVLKWMEKYPNIQYIFAKEVKKKLGNSVLERLLPGRELEEVKEKICYVKPEETYKLEGLTVETLESTDSGVAFLVTCENKCIYHAGDLNWWHWEGEPEQDNQYQAHTYKEQIDSLAGRTVDLAFVVMDPRQEKDMYLGINYFMNHVDVCHVIPMHMWKQYEIVKTYKELPESRRFQNRMEELQHENQEFVYEE